MGAIFRVNINANVFFAAMSMQFAITFIAILLPPIAIDFIVIYWSLPPIATNVDELAMFDPSR